MSLFDFDALASTPLVTEPFEHLIVPNFVTREALAHINADFPTIDQGGSYPLESLSYGAGFAEMANELLSTDLRTAFADKYRRAVGVHPDRRDEFRAALLCIRDGGGMPVADVIDVLNRQ